MAAALPIPPSLEPLLGEYHITLDNTIGALFLSFTISVFLLGLLSFQVHQYYYNHPSDRALLKWMVASVLFFDIGQTVFQVHGLYILFVSKFGDLADVVSPPFTVNASVIWAGFVYCIVEAFFVYRLKVLSSNRYVLPVICWLACAARFVVTIIAGALSLTMPLIQFELQWNNLIHTPIILGVVLDNIIAVLLSYYLFNRAREGIERTRWLARRLIVFSIETGIITSLVGIAALVSYTLVPHNGIWIGILFFHSKIYSNSLLLSLNRRTDLRKSRPTTSRVSSTSMGFASPRSRKDLRDLNNVVIELTRTTRSDTDFTEESSGRELSTNLTTPESVTRGLHNAPNVQGERIEHCSRLCPIHTIDLASLSGSIVTPIPSHAEMGVQV